MNTSFVLGIDPGKSFFAATLLDTDGRPVWKEECIDMSRDGFEILRSKLPAGNLTVAIEASGRIDENLLAWFQGLAATCRDREIKVIRVNPGQSARFGGSKPRRDQTDGSDSAHVAEFARVYQTRLEAFDHDRRIQGMCRLISERERLVEDQTATKNRIHEQIMICFPEFTRVFADPFAKLARAVLRQIPTARCAAGRRPLSLARIKGGRRCASLGIERAQQLINYAGESIASAREEFDGEAMIFLIEHLESLEKRLASIEQILVRYAEQAQPGADRPGSRGISAPQQIRLLDSIPGIGIVAASTLVLGTRGLDRFYSGSALSAQWASCPERVKTGTSLNHTHLTARGDHKKRAMLYLVTQSACNFDPAFAFHKWRMIQRGLCPKQAVCAVMNRMARVIWAMVANNSSYDVNELIVQIRIHHGDLWKTFVQCNQNKPYLWKNVKLEHQKIA
jgi:transposase